MKTSHNIKRGISLYSFQEAYYFQKFDLEDCIAATADMGAEGVEIIPDQMIREFPNVSDDFIDKWHGMMERYGVTPTCMDDFVETRLYQRRKITEDEQVERFIKAAQLANRLGCFIMREQFALGEELMTPSLLERCLPYAEKYNVIIGMEVHAPNYLGNPKIDPFMKIIEKSPHAGLIVDFSIFLRRIPDIINRYYLRHGVRSEVVDFACRMYEDKVETAVALKEAQKLKLSPIEERYFGEQFRFNKPAQAIEPECMKEYAPYIKHFHAKTFEVNEDYTDDSLDVPRILGVIQEMGFQGYVCTEDEGNRYVHDAGEYDCVEQVRRHQKLMEIVLGY